MHLYTSVTFRCGRSRRTSSSYSRSMASEEYDRIVFSRKTTTRTSETHTCGTLIFLPLHSPPIYPPPLFDEEPGNNGNEHHHWRYLLPPIFWMVENRFALARGIGVARKGATGGGRRETRGRKEVLRNEREEEREIGSFCVALYKPTTTVRLPLLCRELITNPVARRLRT